MTPKTRPARRAPRRPARPRLAGHAGELLPIEALAEDGLLIRSDGAFVRYLEAVPSNPLVMDERACQEMTAGFGALLARIPAQMTVQFYVQATPVRLDEVLAAYRTETVRVAADLERSGRPVHADRAAALRGLAAIHEESLCEHADQQAAVQLRYVIVAPYLPDLPVAGAAGTLRRPARRGAVLERPAHAHRRLARESRQHLDGLRAELEAIGLSARVLDGPAVADLLWPRFAPRVSHAGAGTPPSRHAARLIGSLDSHPDRARARRAARALRDAIAQGAISDADHRWLSIDGDLEQTIYVSGRPEHTFYGWVLHAMQSGKPWTLSVHVQALDRASERQRYKAKHRRLFGVNVGAEGAGRVPDYDQRDQEHEVAALLGELSGANTSLYRVSIYQSLREHGPRPDPVALTEAVDQAVRDLSNVVDCRVQRGEFNQLELWQSTLPLGLDVAGKTSKLITRNVADSIPLIGTSCGSPGGLHLGYADPGRTIERLDPFDPLHDNGTLVVNSKSGGGKTTLILSLLSQVLALGGQAAVIDRSAGHYRFLCDLVPGSLHAEIGGEDELTVNPWDVEDTAQVPGAKVSFLVRLHTLLIGDHHADQDSFGLAPLERNLLGLAIRAVYEDAGRTGQVPCESYLREILTRRAAEEAGADGGSAEVAATYRSLTERLHDYCGDGAYGYLLDRPTTVELADAPLIVFDTKRVPEDVSPAVLFVLADTLTTRIEQRREQHLQSDRAGRGDSGMFEGRFVLVLEELWKLVGRRATGEWLNELARRARHLGLCLACVTQQRSDLAGEHGRALLRNSTMQIFLRQSSDELAYLADALKLTDEEIGQISRLKTEKRGYAQAFVLNGTRGRGTIAIRLGRRAYWLATNDPINDTPVRERALREAGGDPWRALELLADPAWHRELAA